MSDDDELRGRFATLHRESTAGVQPPSFDQVRGRSRHLTTQRRFAWIGAVLGVVAVVFGVGQLTHLTEASPSPSSPTQSVGPPTTAPTGVDATGFGPEAASFVSADQGWVLAAGTCDRCGVLSETTDGGRTWSTVSGSVRPPGVAGGLAGGQLDMVFANKNDGYVFASTACTSSCVIVTKDGGHTWAPAPLPASVQLIVTGATLYGLAADAGSSRPAALFTSTPGAASWDRLTLPASTPDATIAADGDSVAFLQKGGAATSPADTQLGRLWTSSDRGRTWTIRTNPCTGADGGAALVSMAPGHPDALLIDCFDDEQSQQAQRTQHHIYGSGDGGAHWVRLADPTHIGDPTLLVDNGNGHAFLATQSGGANILAATLDGGLGWHPAITNTSGFFGWADLRFVNSSVGFVLGPTHYAPTRLYRTQDAGKTWHTISLPRRPRR